MKTEKDLYNLDDVLNYQVRLVSYYKGISYEEKYQIAYIGYLKAKENFNPKYDRMSLNYACRYIRKELVNSIKKDIRAVSGIQASDEFEVVDDAEEKINPTDDQKLEDIKNLLSELTEIESEVIYQSYFAEKPLTQPEIAVKYKVTAQRIQQIKDEAIKKLKIKLKWRE